MESTETISKNMYIKSPQNKHQVTSTNQGTNKQTSTNKHQQNQPESTNINPTKTTNPSTNPSPLQPPKLRLGETLRVPRGCNQSNASLSSALLFFGVLQKKRAWDSGQQATSLLFILQQQNEASHRFPTNDSRLRPLCLRPACRQIWAIPRRGQGEAMGQQNSKSRDHPGVWEHFFGEKNRSELTKWDFHSGCFRVSLFGPDNHLPSYHCFRHLAVKDRSCVVLSLHFVEATMSTWFEGFEPGISFYVVRTIGLCFCARR